MENFVISRLPVAGGAPRYPNDRFFDLGAVLAGALELQAAHQAGQGPQPASVIDLGERLLLGEHEIERLAVITGQASPVGDQVARTVFGNLDDSSLDLLCRWLAFRMRTAGIPRQQRLHLLGAILDAASPGQ